MTKGDIHMLDKRISIRPEVAKRKYPPCLFDGLPDTVWSWLEAVDFDGTIDTVNYADRRRSLYKLAGITEIPNSATRHSFATYAYAKL